MNISNMIINYITNINPLYKNNDNINNVKLRRRFDSLGMVAFLSFLEESFSITIKDSDVTSKNFETVNTVIKFIINKNNNII